MAPLYNEIGNSPSDGAISLNFRVHKLATTNRPEWTLLTVQVDSWQLAAAGQLMTMAFIGLRSTRG